MGNSNIDRQGALDWAHSIQTRYAEKRAAEAVRLGNTTTLAELLSSDYLKYASQQLSAIGAEAAQWTSEITNITPTPRNELDDVFARGILESIYKRVETTFRAGFAASAEPPLAQLDKLILSSLPSGNIIAFCAKNTWDQYNYIFVDGELFTLCNMMSKILILCLAPMADSNGNLSKIESRKPIEVAQFDRLVIGRCLDLFARTALSGEARRSTPWILPTQYISTAARLCRDMELFIVAHEVAHVICAHFESAEAYSAEVFAGQSGEALAFSRDAEFEADGVALLLALSTARIEGDDGVMASLGTYLFLKTIELLYACQAVFGNALDNSLSTHPSPTDRATRLRPLIVHLSGNDRWMGKLLTRADQIYFQLTRHTLTMMRKLAAAGLRPRPLKGRRLLESDRPLILGVAPLANLLETDRFKQMARTLNVGTVT